MTESAAVPSRMTVAEFLAWNPPGDTRYELVDGRPVMMAPPKEAHGTIAGNVAAALGPLLRRPCRLVLQAGVLRDDQRDRYFEADLAVTCAPPEAGRQALEAPRLIMEILSRSTRAHDLGTKLDRYRELEAVEEIVLVSSEARRVTYWRRAPSGWHVQDVIGKGGVRLGPIDEPLDLDTICADVVLAEA